MVGTDNLDAGHHVVQFYGRDEELADTVSGYLLEGIRDGAAAVVIATGEHRREFEARLRRGGVDLATARDSGTYLAIDAGQTLRALMAGDGLDHAVLERAVGSLIRRAGAGGRSVRAYGEMVALLWDDGMVNDAVQLEALWDELARRHSFSVFCAYPAGSVGRDGYLEAFAEVCRLHREIVGLWPADPGPGVPGAVRAFPGSRQAPAAARHFAVAALDGWGAGDFADDVALVVTELAANAVLHAHSGFTVVLSVRGDVLRIAVRDGQPLPPGVRPGGHGGAVPPLIPAPLHGLGTVDALASKWGVEPAGPAGKTVWAELRRALPGGGPERRAFTGRGRPGPGCARTVPRAARSAAGRASR